MNQKTLDEKCRISLLLWQQLIFHSCMVTFSFSSEIATEKHFQTVKRASFSV
jgi:hypothetical protein